MKNKIWFGVNRWLIPLLSSLLLVIVVITITLSSSGNDLDQKDNKFANAQAQNKNATNKFMEIPGAPLYHSNNGKITALRATDAG